MKYVFVMLLMALGIVTAAELYAHECLKTSDLHEGN